MWLDYIENPKGLKSIYKEKIPALENINIYGIVIMPGEDLELQLVLKINQMPQEIPKKWKDKGVNKLSLTIRFLDVHFDVLEQIDKSLNDSSLVIKGDTDGLKKVQILGSRNDVLMSFVARWIDIFEMTGAKE